MRTTILLLMLFPIGTFAQAIGFDVGSSSSIYKYQNENGAALDVIEQDPGTSIGVFKYFSSNQHENLSVKAGLRYQEMNAKAFENNVPISYQTSYLSFSGVLEYNLFSFYTDTFCDSCNFISSVFYLGGEVGHILEGRQTLLNNSYNLTKEPEFNGVLFGPIAGLGLRFNMGFDMSLTLDYAQTYFFNSHQKPERLNFKRSLLTVGLIKGL
jgi:hypothetical protein